MIKYIDRELIKSKNLTQNEVILLHLVTNGFITNKQASDNYGFHHLPSIIRNLKKNYGCKFNNIKQRGMFNRFSQMVDYEEYHLVNKKEIGDWLNIH